MTIGHVYEYCKFLLPTVNRVMTATLPLLVQQSQNLNQTLEDYPQFQKRTQESELASDYLHHTDEEFDNLLKKIPAHMDFLVSADSEIEPVEHDDPSDRMPSALLTASAEDLRHMLAHPVRVTREPEGHGHLRRKR